LHQPWQCLRREKTLVAQIVDSEDGCSPLKEVVAAEAGLQIDRQQRRLPVVGMQNIRLEIDSSAYLQSRPAEQGEALRIVWVILRGRALIQAITVKRRIVANKVDRRTAGKMSLQHVHRLRA
jgi:hypothetical protein